MNKQSINSGYSKGKMSKILAINILLAILIVGTVFVLLKNNEIDYTSQAVVKTPPPNLTAKTPQPAPPANKQAEIEALKKQLEREASNLEALRVTEKQIAAIRNATQLEADNLAAEEQAALTQKQAVREDAPTDKKTK